jgi:hypothetical protein
VLLIVDTKFDLFCILTISMIKYFSWMIGTWMKNKLTSDSNCNIVNLDCPNCFIRLGSHVVLLTLNMQLTISIEQDKEESW